MPIAIAVICLIAVFCICATALAMQANEHDYRYNIRNSLAQESAETREYTKIMAKITKVEKDMNDYMEVKKKVDALMVKSGFNL